jgi:hypothetical protein
MGHQMCHIGGLLVSDFNINTRPSAATSKGFSRTKQDCLGAQLLYSITIYSSSKTLKRKLNHLFKKLTLEWKSVTAAPKIWAELTWHQPSTSDLILYTRSRISPHSLLLSFHPWRLVLEPLLLLLLQAVAKAQSFSRPPVSSSQDDILLEIRTMWQQQQNKSHFRSSCLAGVEWAVAAPSSSSSSSSSSSFLSACNIFQVHWTRCRKFVTETEGAAAAAAAADTAAAMSLAGRSRVEQRESHSGVKKEKGVYAFELWMIYQYCKDWGRQKTDYAFLGLQLIHRRFFHRKWKKLSCDWTH